MIQNLLERFSEPITTVEQLRAFAPGPSPIARDKVIDHIDGFCAEFIERALI